MANGNEKELTNPENQKDAPSQDFKPLPTTSVDLFKGEVEGARIPGPIEHKGVDVQSFIDYTGTDINLLTDDAEAIRARNQSGWEQAGAFINQAVLGEIVGGSIEGLGYLLDVKGMVDIAKGREREWGNWLSDIGKGLRELTQEGTPIYQEDPGSFNPWDSGWWFGNGVSVASTLSLMIPSGMALKGLSMAGRGLSKGARLINKGLDVASKFDKASGFTKDAVRGISHAMLSRHAENMMEASSMFEEKYNDLIEKGIPEEAARERASEGASTVYQLNSAMLAQDIIQYTILHRLTGRGAITPTKGAEAVSKQAANLGKGKYAAMLGDFVTEGAEEAYQYIAAEEGKYLADVNAGLRDPSNLSARLKTYMNDGELMTNAFFGGLGSFVMQTVGPKIMEKLSKQTPGLGSDPVDFMKASAAIRSQTDHASRAARDAGYDEYADNLEDLSVVHMTLDNLERGQEDVHMRAMEAFASMTEEEAQEYANTINEHSDATIDPQRIIDRAPDQRDIAEQTIKTYRGLRDRYGKEIAGPATLEDMTNRLNRKVKQKKEEQLIEHKTQIPEYEELSPKGQQITDLRMEVQGLKRAKKAVQTQIEKAEEDEKLSTRLQTILSNIDSNLETAESNLKKEQGKEYEAADEKSDKQKMQTLDTFIEEGAKLVSERELADQMATAARNAYNEKLQLYKDKKEIENLKEKKRRTQEFHAETIAADDGSRPKKGDPVTFNGQPGEYDGSFQKQGETIHKIRDLSKDTLTHWTVKEEDFDEKVSKRKYKQDVQDEAQARQDREKLHEDQRKGEEHPQAEQVSEVTEALQKAKTDIGPAENIEVPPNETDDPHKPSSPRRQRVIQSGLSLAIASTNNPKSQVSQRLAEGLITEESEQYKDAKALTDFFENQSPVTNPDGSYRYYVETTIDMNYLEENFSEQLVNKVKKREVLTQEELDKLPIQVKFFNYADDTPVTMRGREVYTYLHTPSFLDNNMDVPTEQFSKEVQKLRKARELAYTQYRHLNTAVAPVIKQEDGHFFEDPTVELGNFETYNNLSEVLGENPENIELAVLDSSGAYTGQNGQVLESMLTVKENNPDNAGAVYARVTAANGRPKPMRLFVDTFTDEEANLLWSLYKKIISGTNPASTLSNDIKSQISNSADSRVKAIEDVLNLDDVSHMDMINFLVFEGKEKTAEKGESTLWADLRGKDSKLYYGTNPALTREDFEGDKMRHSFTDWLQNNRRRQVDRKFLNTPQYNRYLIDNKIVATTTKISEDNRVMIGPTTVVGEFGTEARPGDIDYVEDASKPKETRDEDQDDQTTMGDFYQKKTISDRDSLPESLGQRGMVRLLDRLQQKFNVPYQLIDDPEVQWSGKVENGTVFINTAYATLDTPFHEYAHPFVHQIKRNNVRLYMGLVEEMRKSTEGRKILSRVQRDYSDLTIEQQYDEAIVQALGEMASDSLVEDESSFRRFIREIWMKIQRMIRNLLGTDIKVDPSEISITSSMKNLSEMLSDNLTSIDLSGSLVTAEQRPEGFTSQEYKDWVDSMTFVMVKSNNSDDLTDLTGIRMNTILTAVRNTYNRMDEDDPLRGTYQRVLNEITDEDGNLDPNSKLLLAVQRRLKSYGIVPDQEVDPEQADARLNIRASYEFSSKDKASANVKLMVAMIPQLKSNQLVINKFSRNNNDTKPDYDLSPITGLPRLHNFEAMWQTLQTTLSDTVETIKDGRVEDRYEVFRQKLEDASNLRPELGFLLDYLQKAPEYKQTEFTNVLSLASQNFSSTFFSKSGDNMRFNIGGSDTQSVSDQIIDEWSAGWKDIFGKSMRMKEDGQIKVVLDQQKAESAVRGYEDLVSRTLEISQTRNVVPDELKQDLVNLLESIGVTINPRTVDKLIQDTEKGKTEMDKFVQLLRGTKGTSIRFMFKEDELSLDKLSKKPITIPQGEEVKLSVNSEAFARKMAEAESYFRPQLVDSTVLGPDNKPFWMFSQFNAMYRKIAEWKRNKAPIKHILSAPYNGNSVWGKWLLESQENRNNFKLSNFINFRQRFSGDRGNKNTDLGISDLLADKINRMLRGIYSLPARADNTTEYQIEGPPTIKSFRVNNAGKLELTDEAVSVVRGYILDEIARIKHAEAQRELLPDEQLVKDYHYKMVGDSMDKTAGNAYKIHLMPSLNDPAKGLFNRKGEVITPNSENFIGNDKLNEYIRKSFSEQFQRDLKEMVDNRVVLKSQGQYENNAIDIDAFNNYLAKTGRDEAIAVQAAVMDYTFNGIVANQEWHKLFGGDIASYVSREDFQKRATAPGSTGLMYRIMEDMSPTYNSAVVNDIIAPSEILSDESIKEIAEYTGRTQKEVRELLADYEEVDRADAQAWITPEQYRDRMRGYGKWTPEHKAAYIRLMEGNQRPEDISFFMQPLKTVHTEMKIQNGASIFHYNKQSEAVLHPDLAQALNIGNLLVAMRDNNVDHVVVESGKKAGASGITPIVDEDGNILSAEDITLNPVALDKRYLFLQQELPTKGMKPLKEGSQVRKNILEGIKSNDSFTLDDGTEIRGSQLLSEIHKAIGALSDKGLQEVFDFIGYNGETLTEENMERLYDFLIQSFTRREVNDNLLRALQNRVPFDAIPQMRTNIENQLASLINKRAVDLRHDTGGSYIQMSDVGWTTKADVDQMKMVTWIDKGARNGLKRPRIEDGQFKPGQILIPHKIVEQFPELSLQEIAKMLSKASVGVSYRIPNQSTSSNDVIEIAGILPPEMGDTVVAYKEVTTKFGSDFDIDKLQVMLPNYQIIDGNIQVIEFKNIDTNNDGQLKQLYRDQYGSKKRYLEHLTRLLDEKVLNLASSDTGLISFLEETNSDDIVIDAKRNVTYADYTRLQSEVDSMMSEDEFVRTMKGESVYKVNSKKAVQNRKLELYRAKLSSPSTYLKMVSPLESSWLEESIRANQPKENYSKDLEAFSPTVQAKIRKTFVDTKAAVGQVANHSTDHSFSQSANLYLKKPSDQDSIVPFYLGIGNDIETEAGKATFLSAIESENGESIMETLSAFLTANVDASKDPYITDGNFNLFTNNIALLLIRAGAPRNFVVDFMDQPILRELSRVVAEYEGRTSPPRGVPGKKTTTAIEWLTYRWTQGFSDKPVTDISEVIDVESVDPRQLMKNLREDKKSGKANQERQLKSLALFLQWKPFADALNQSIQASKADVNGAGASLISAQTKANMKQKVIDDGLIGNFENKFKGTFLERFHENSVEALRRVFGGKFLHQTNAMQDLIEDVASKIGQDPLTNEDIAFTIAAEAYAFAMSKTSFGLSDTEVESMYRGKKSMARKLQVFKTARTSPIRENPLIKYLGYKTADVEGGLDFIYGQGTKQLTVEAQNELTQAWEDLLTHDNEAVREFAENLARYAYYSSGFRRNLTSFYELIPTTLNDSLGITEEIRSLFTDLNRRGHPLAHATDQILKNLSEDSRIVPTLSSKSPIQLGGLTTSKLFGILPGDNKFLQVGTDNDGRPVMKPYVKMGDQLYEYRGLGQKKIEEGDAIKEQTVAVYTPTNNLGIKQGRFTIKEYRENSSGETSIFEENNIEVDKKVEDIVRSLGTQMNYVAQGPVEIQETSRVENVDQEVIDEAVQRLQSVAKDFSGVVADDYVDTKLKEYKEIADATSLDEFIQAERNFLKSCK